MTNVSVSRAKDRLIVVTAHNGVPHSKNVSALLDYIRMYDPRGSVESDIVSIFDVLYSAYSASLERYSRAKWSNWKRTPAENVADLCLREVLADQKYSTFGYHTEVPLWEALPNTRRLSEEQRAFVFTDSALDFGVFSRVTRRVVLAIEVDGWITATTRNSSSATPARTRSWPRMACRSCAWRRTNRGRNAGSGRR